MALPSKYGIDKKINSMEGLSAYENGGKGSGNFGHSGRPGQVGGSGDGTGETIDEKIKRAEEYAEISADRSASWVEEADKEAARDLGLEPDVMAPTKGEFWREAIAMLEAKKDKTNPKTGNQEKEDGGKYAKRKDYKAEQEGVDVRDGHRIGTEFADLEAQLSTARTNLKQMQKDKETAYDDLAGRNRYLTRQSEIARAFSQARALGKSKLSTETKKLVKEMESELKEIKAKYEDLGTKKYFDPDLNVER